MEWFLKEEVVILLLGLAGCALLVLGILNAIWPTASRRARAGAEPAAVAAPAALPLFPDLPPSRVRSFEEDRAEVALRVGRALLARALEDPDPASNQRVTLLCRSIACLDRGLSAAPDNTRLRDVLDEAHAALAKTDRQTALRRLAAEMPWRTPTLVLAPAASR